MTAVKVKRCLKSAADRSASNLVCEEAALNLGYHRNYRISQEITIRLPFFPSSEKNLNIGLIVEIVCSNEA